MSRARKNLAFMVIGLCLVAACVVTGIVVVTGRDDDSVAYCALMPDSIGLYTGNPVTQMGYEIGTVTSVSPEGAVVRVEFTALASRPLPADVVAVTRSKSVLADRSLELVGNYQSGARLRPDTCIAPTSSHTPASISQITGSAGDLIEQIAPEGDTKALAGALSGLSESVDGIGPDVARLLTTAGRAAREPDRTVSDIGTIITTLAPLSDNAIRQWPEIKAIAQQIGGAMESVGSVLWPGAVKIVDGIVPVLTVLLQIQTKYGKDIWPGSDFGFRIAASHAGEIQNALSSLPALADSAVLAWRRSRGAELTVPGTAVVRAPSAAALCRAIGQYTSCRPVPGDARSARVGIGALFVLAGALR